ncbi:DUF4344 domain-containing metallopeptidase [Vibrio parahaemolyticus]|uniref:DUF4344 domain-containing metallopeptidase n=1 Tax=Vibrio parahaemolyticus TaxID=670 RepID=UPI00389131F6
MKIEKIKFVLISFFAISLTIFIIKQLIPSKEIEISYSSSVKNKEEEEIRQWVINENIFEPVVEFINSEINLNRDIKVLVGEGEESDAYYSYKNFEVKISYSFILSVQNLFQKKYDDEKANLYTKDFMTFVLYHELGHALIHTLQIPVLGKEEDAVDDFANILLILSDEDGQEMVISGADYFLLSGEAQEVYDYLHLTDVHSIDEQRGYRGLSLVFGSDPEKYNEILDLDRENKEIHKLIFITQTYNWLTNLKPHLKKGILLMTLKQFNGKNPIPIDIKSKPKQ